MTKDKVKENCELMRDLCRLVVDTQFEDLPNYVVDSAKRSILDTFAVTVGGSAMEGIKPIVDFVKDKGGKAESLIPFYGGKVPASEAGFAIGPMSRAMDFGDIHEEASHCSEYIFPALLGATGLKERVTGKEFLTSFVLGQEVLIRIGVAYKARSEAGLNNRNSGHFIFGCVAAVGKLLGMSLNTLLDAEGIVSEMTQPHSQAMFVPPTLMIRTHHGFICQDAINACLLAGKGISGPLDILNAPHGYLGFAKWETDENAITNNLGEKWEMTNLTMKRYPAVISSQWAIGAIIEIMREHQLKPEEIAEIYIDTSLPLESNETERKRWHPQLAHECQFSMPFAVATAACDGDVFIDSYNDEARNQECVREMMEKISIKRVSILPDGSSVINNLPERLSRIRTVLYDGREFSKEGLFPQRHSANPLTNVELSEKFKKCASYSAYKLSESTIDFLIDSTLNLENVEDFVDTILRRVTPE